MANATTNDETFIKYFNNLAEKEDVLEKFSCAIQKTILYQGTMWVTRKHICFFAKLLGKKVQETISFSEITAIEKKMTTKVIPNAIEITVKSGHSYWFSSFFSRDQTFALLEQEWTKAKGKKVKVGATPLEDDHDPSLPHDSERKFQKHFGDITQEPLKLCYPCSYQKKKSLQQGTLFLSSKFICFYGKSNSLQKPTKRTVSATDVISIEKNTNSGFDFVTKVKRYSLKSFLNRDKAFEEVNLLWKRANGEHTPAQGRRESQSNGNSAEDKKRKAESDFRLHFPNVNSSDKLVEYWKCEYDTKVGIMYGCSKGVYFYSERDDFNKVQISIPFNEVSSVQEESQFGIDGIAISKKSQSYTFIEFRDRNATLRAIQSLISSYKKQVMAGESKTSQRRSSDSGFESISLDSSQPTDQKEIVELETADDEEAERNAPVESSSQLCKCIIV